MLAKATLILWLFVSPFAPFRPGPQATPHVPSSVRQSPEMRSTATPLVLVRNARSTAAATATASTAGGRHRRIHRAAARAVERRLLVVAPHTRLLARFVDRSTDLVKLNVTAHCRLKQRPQRHSIYLCRVWRQPRQPSSGVRVLCRTKHKRFVVTAYRRRRRR
jgi:hypothetical protein